MSIVSRVFDKYQGIKGDWASASWDAEHLQFTDAEGVTRKGVGYRSNSSSENYSTCNGVCAMGAIHVDLGRPTANNPQQYEIVANIVTQRQNQRLGIKPKNPVDDVDYGMLLRSWLYAAADVAANTIWHRWAAVEKAAGNAVLNKTDGYGNYRHEIMDEEQLPYADGIISWNDDPQTSEEELREFFTILSDHAEYRQARILLDLNDEELGRRYGRPFFDWRTDDEIQRLPDSSAVLIYQTLKGANVI